MGGVKFAAGSKGPLSTAFFSFFSVSLVLTENEFIFTSKFFVGTYWAPHVKNSSTINGFKLKWVDTRVTLFHRKLPKLTVQKISHYLV